MSTPFYDLASLVVVPSGYKASKVYAQKPLTTDGQLAFTRSTTATRVNSAGLIEASAINVPRLDYLGSTCPKLLLEPSRTNLTLQSSAFDNAAWTKSNSTITANAAVSPDGTTSADKIVEAATTSGHSAYEAISVTNGATYTLSVFAKAAERTRVWVDLYGGTNAAVFDLTNGTILATSGGSTSKIENYGNGWYRCSVTSTAPDPTLYVNVGPTTGNTTNNSYTGNGTSGILAWGCQLEAGAYATSYIPTLGASVTRGADAASKTGISSLIGQTEGTIYWEVSNISTYSGNGARFFSYTDGSNFILINPYGTVLRVLIVSSGTTFDNFLAVSSDSLKIAVAYKANDYKFYVNGVSLGTPVATSVPAMSAIGIFEDTTPAGVSSQCKTSQLLLFKTRLTNAQLAELTTI